MAFLEKGFGFFRGAGVGDDLAGEIISGGELATVSRSGIGVDGDGSAQYAGRGLELAFVRS